MENEHFEYGQSMAKTVDQHLTTDFDAKCEVLSKLGIDPKKLQGRNPQFFQNIMRKVRTDGCYGTDKVPSDFWWAEGDPELWEKMKPKPKPKTDEKVLARLQRVRGKWSKSKAKALAEAELQDDLREDARALRQAIESDER